jgi:hypothetical protein
LSFVVPLLFFGGSFSECKYQASAVSSSTVTLSNRKTVNLDKIPSRFRPGSVFYRQLQINNLLVPFTNQTGRTQTTKG